MGINLNDKNFNIESVSQLLASKDDSEDRQLRVTLGGCVYLSDIVGSESIENISFRFETWDEGNGYVGEVAAQDKSWVDTIYNCLKDNWPNPKSRYIDCYWKPVTNGEPAPKN